MIKSNNLIDSPGTGIKSSLFSPPRAPLTFRTGIVGHRPDRLGNADIEALKNILKSILNVVKGEVLPFAKSHADFYDSSTPVLRAISPLAEGTDRLFAEQALDLGFEICCVMPFAQAEFEKDFLLGRALEPDSLTHFHELLARAKKESRLTRFELDGNRENTGRAYGAGGRVVLNQSDILIVVWDGKLKGKIGGTEETFSEARNQGTPVVWVDACAPHEWQILGSDSVLPEISEKKRLPPDGSGNIENLKRLVTNMLELPIIEAPTDIKQHNIEKETTATIKKNLMDFFTEHQPKKSYYQLWKAFRDIFGDSKRPDVSSIVTPFEAAVINDWPENRSTPFNNIVERLRPFYAWPDKLAVIYSDRYRSAFLLAFLLAAISVGLALTPVALTWSGHSGLETFPILLELLAIIIILFMIYTGRRRRWHERWIDYRLVAELVRHLRLVAALGGGRPFPQIPAHYSTYGQPGSSWMSWYVRTVERDLGIPTVVVDKKYLDECLTDLLKQMTGQLKYHQINAERSQLIENRLHFWGYFFLGTTLLACSLHLLPGFIFKIYPPEGISNFLTACCGFFPALGAAIAGIINQGEFRRVSKRSISIQGKIGELLKKIEKLKKQVASTEYASGQQFSSKAVELASAAARLMIYEVLDWRVVFLDRPLHPPG
jgi:hypothetical protein